MLGSHVLLSVQIIIKWRCFNGLYVQPEAEITVGRFCPFTVNLLEKVAVTLLIPFTFITVHKRLLSE